MLQIETTFLLVGPSASIANHSKSIVEYVNSGGLASDSGMDIVPILIEEPTFAPTIPPTQAPVTPGIIHI